MGFLHDMQIGLVQITQILEQDFLTLPFISWEKYIDVQIRSQH
jgi:hypothetical protein